MVKFSFEPATGLNDTTVFVSSPTSEAQARQQFMTLFNQLRDFLNSGNLEAGMLGGKSSSDYIQTATANNNYAPKTHSHSEYATSTHSHATSEVGLTWGTGNPNNSDGKADGTIYYKIES